MAVKKMRMERSGFGILIALIFISVFSLPAPAQQGGSFCFSGTACRDNGICETRVCLDFSGNINTEIVSCSSCGTREAICRDGSAASCQKTCQEINFVAQCVECDALQQCGAAPAGRQSSTLSLLTFEVTTVQVSISPAKIELPSAQQTAFEVTVRNPLPVDMPLQFAVSMPSGWTYEFPQQAQLKAGATQSFPLSVKPPPGISGTHEIKVAAVNVQLRIASTASAVYAILPANAPTLSVAPQSFTGTPEQRGLFTISVKDNNPETFPSSGYALDVKPPGGWGFKLSSKSFILRPGEGRNVSLEITPNATPEGGLHNIEVKLIYASNASASSFISYTITLCGDNICQVGEEGEGGSCAADCPLTAIKCNGRCESELDWGVKYRASIDTLTTRFIVCRRGASAAECEAAFAVNNCGAGKACLCGSSTGTECDVRCVDAKGAYYMLAKSVGSTLLSANYSYSCPLVNLKEIIDMRGDFIAAKTEYEKSRSALQEIIGRTSNVTERAKYQPCSQGLSLITDNITDYVRLLDGVIAFPGKQNTTLARARAAELQLFIENTFATYCKTTLGILRIDNVDPPAQTEVGKKATARVDIKNIGNVNYYGYVECDFINPAGRPERERISCTLVPQGAANSFQLSHEINSSGDWKLKCRVIGSLKSDCSSEVHDESQVLSFSAYTKEIFVRDIAVAESAGTILCSVRTSRPAQCVGCRVGAGECTKARTANETTTFECPAAVGNVEVTGYVFATDDCIPTEPKNKTAIARIRGCGDGVVDKGEECEPPNQKSTACSQESFRCDEVTRKYGTRSAQGLCSAQCKCVASEQFTYKCVANKCGAVCNEGDVRNLSDGCIEKCSDTCGWVKDCSGRNSFVFDAEKSVGTSKGGVPVDYRAVLKNTGPEQDTFAFKPENATVLADGQTSSGVTLASGSQKEITVRVVPKSAQEGYVETSSVEIQSGKSGKRVVSYTTIISAVTNAPPSISNIAHLPAAAKKGGQITFFADVADPDGDAISSASVCGDVDCVKTLCSLTLAGTSGSCTYIAESTGEQSYYVQAKDGRDGISTSSARTFFVEDSAPLTQPGTEPPEIKTESTEGSLIFNIIIVALAILMAGLAYHFRDELKERLQKFRIWWNYRFG